LYSYSLLFSKNGPFEIGVNNNNNNVETKTKHVQTDVIDRKNSKTASKSISTQTDISLFENI